MNFAYVALGSNLGDSAGVVRHAMDRLREFSDEPILKSSLWHTTPVDCPPGSPPFVNAAARLLPRINETPELLLLKLRDLEKTFGRGPGKIRNEPRPLDLDLIMYGGVILKTPQITLPHPRAHLRRFVLQPLSEIAPELILPGQTISVATLLAGLPSQELVQRLSP